VFQNSASGGLLVPAPNKGIEKVNDNDIYGSADDTDDDTDCSDDETDKDNKIMKIKHVETVMSAWLYTFHCTCKFPNPAALCDFLLESIDNGIFLFYKC
jgi:hypothetical protein